MSGGDTTASLGPAPVPPPLSAEEFRALGVPDTGAGAVTGEAERWGRLAVSAALVLTALGVLMVYSSSSVRAALQEGDGTYFLKRQLAWAGLGICAMGIAMRTPLSFWKRNARPLMVVTLAALVAVLFLGTTLNGARRWFRIGSLSFQPSELSKLTMLIFVAAWLTEAKDRLHDFRRGCVPVALALGAAVLLINREPDFGTALFVGALGAGLLVVGGVRLGHMALLAVPILPVLAISVLTRLETIRSRFAFTHGNTGYQVRQGLVALGSGGLVGEGLGAGRAKLFFLPEGSSDFILAVIGEELGLAGTLLVVLLYAAFVRAGARVCAVAAGRDRFAFLLSFGVTLWVGLQAAINVAVVTAWAPTKGIALPFVSLGGSGLVVLLAATGILYAAAREVDRVAAAGAADPVPTEVVA